MASTKVFPVKPTVEPKKSDNDFPTLNNSETSHSNSKTESLEEKYTEISVDTPKLSRKKSSSEFVVTDYKEREEEQVDSQVWLIRYDSVERLILNTLVIIAIAITAILTPIQVVYNIDANEHLSLLLLNVFVDIIFWVDLLLNFRTTFPQVPGRPCIKITLKVIRSKYLRGWFFIDFLSCITGYPLAIIIDEFEKNGIWSNFGNLKILKVFTVLRLLKFVQLLKLLRLAKMSRAIQFFEDHFLATRHVVFAVKFIFGAFLFAHFNACLFSFSAQLDSDGRKSTSWVALYTRNDLVNGSIINEYIHALYWSFTTFTTTGFGDIVPYSTFEIIYSTLAMCVGASLYGFLIGRISALTTATQFHQIQLSQKLEAAKAYLKHKRFPPELKRRAYRHMQFYYERKGALDENEILSIMSEPLKSEVTEYLASDTLARLPFFKALDASSRGLLMGKLKPIRLAAGDRLIHVGEQGTEMYILLHGVMDVINKNGVVVHKIMPVTWFGEWAALGKVKYRTANVDARTDAELLSLCGNDIADVFMGKNPSVLAHIYAVVDKLFAEKQKEIGTKKCLESQTKTIKPNTTNNTETNSNRPTNLKSPIANRNSLRLGTKKSSKSKEKSFFDKNSADLLEAFSEKITKKLSNIENYFESLEKRISSIENLLEK